MYSSGFAPAIEVRVRDALAAAARYHRQWRQQSIQRARTSLEWLALEAVAIEVSGHWQRAAVLAEVEQPEHAEMLHWYATKMQDAAERHALCSYLCEFAVENGLELQ